MDVVRCGCFGVLVKVVLLFFWGDGGYLVSWCVIKIPTTKPVLSSQRPIRPSQNDTMEYIDTAAIDNVKYVTFAIL